MQETWERANLWNVDAERVKGRKTKHAKNSDGTRFKSKNQRANR